MGAHILQEQFLTVRGFTPDIFSSCRMIVSPGIACPRPHSMLRACHWPTI